MVWEHSFGFEFSAPTNRRRHLICRSYSQHIRKKASMRFLYFAIAALSAVSLLPAQTQSMLMISVDGMRPDYVLHADEHGLRLPTLRRIMKEGTYAEGVTGVLPTLTYPSHTTLVTGVWPAQHGIFNNQRFDPEHNMDGAWYWYADQIRVPTLWSAAHAAGLKTASVGWPVTADSRDIDFLIPEYWRASVSVPTNPDDLFLMNALSRPLNELNNIEARAGIPYMAGNDTSFAGDEIKTAYALDILKQQKPQFMTIHLSSLDEEQHLHGPFSAQANADLERLDGMLKRLIEQERHNDPGAVVVIVSDHGFVNISHKVNLGAAFVDDGLMQSSAAGTPGALAWQAQPWGFGGMFAIMLHDPNDVATKQKVRALLDKLAAQPGNGIEDILDTPQIAALGGPPDATYIVTLRKGYAPGVSLSGPLVTDIPGRQGNHGYNPATTPEMRASFFAAGPGIAGGKNLGVIDMRSIAPALADLLGISLPAAKPVFRLHSH
jgi:predicted AlkP superfamily pyrophosphatase or phosphodiesterase